MRKHIAGIVALVVTSAVWSGAKAPDRVLPGAEAPDQVLPGAQAPAKMQPGGYVVEHDADIQKAEPGTHNGGGQTVGYTFFEKVPKLALVFRKRVLEPGSAIGYHLQEQDEIYYVLSGRGMMTVDGKSFEVGPGTAVLTRPGSSHGLKQLGDKDLVVLLNYEQKY